MTKNRMVARCTACGHEQPRWTGQCPGCDAWGTIEEQALTAGVGRAAARAVPVAAATPIAAVPLDAVARLKTGMGELDRVLGGGLVPGSVVLLGGAPGVGKSTLLLQAADALAGRRKPTTTLYVSAEESAGQVRLRAERLSATSERLLVAAETTLPAVLALLERHQPDVLILDSIQTVNDPQRDSSPGSVTQVRECAAALVRHAKARGVATLLVGHVTKEGTIAGPRMLEHLVDVVLAFDGDRDHALRLLRAVKNRFGAAGEVGCFEMLGDGLAEVADPSRLFTTAHERPVPGVAVTVTVEGPRPLIVEVQALTVSTKMASPRRQTTGLDPARLALLAAVLERRATIELSSHDLFASAVGGVRLREPAADLALCLAMASSRTQGSVALDAVVIGEVGLAGEVRGVPEASRRLAEAARLGYRRAIVPGAYDGGAHGLELTPVGDLATALRVGMTGLAHG